MTPPKQTCLY